MSYEEISKKNIIYKHRSILNSYEYTYREKKYNISRKYLYNIYINALNNKEKLLSELLDKIDNKPVWINNKNKDVWSKINYLERILFGKNIFKEIGDIKSLENIGKNKCVGYSQDLILTRYYINKYCGKEFMILENIYDTWQSIENKSSMDIWIIHKPTFIKIYKKYPLIFKKLGENNIIYSIIKYIMRNVVSGEILEFVREIFGEKI